MGWLVTDGYGAYSNYPKRQHCLAHLIRKAIALTQALDKEVADLGQWLLEEQSFNQPKSLLGIETCSNMARSLSSWEF